MFARHVLSLISAWLLGWWVIGQPAERSLLVPSAAQEEVILVMPFSAADSGGGDRLSQYLVAELNRSASALRPVPYDTAVERADILPVPDPNCITGRQLANILSYPAMVCGSLVRGAGGNHTVHARLVVLPAGQEVMIEDITTDDIAAAAAQLARRITATWAAQRRRS